MDAARARSVGRRTYVATAVLAALQAPDVNLRYASGAEVRAYMPVTAHVVERFTLRILREPRQLVVSDADVKRGHITLPIATRVDVVSQRPCLLEFRPVGTIVESSAVTTRSARTSFGADGAVLLQHVHGSARIEVTYTFVLAPGAKPGTYAWPLVLTIVPL